jgi:hypothetical protein
MNVSKCCYQLRNGGLLRCDCMFTNQSRFSNKTILKLGTGIGFVALLLVNSLLKLFILVNKKRSLWFTHKIKNFQMKVLVALMDDHDDYRHIDCLFILETIIAFNRRY